MTTYRFLVDFWRVNCLNWGVKGTIIYYRNNKEYYLEPSQILFFEADDDNTYAHTAQHIYRVRHRLYALESMLPEYFFRVSKSGLANTRLVLAFSSVIGTTGMVEFYGSLKTLHVSRKNIKPLKRQLSSERSTK